MSDSNASSTGSFTFSLHWLGVVCGLGAGAWLGTAEAPTKLVVAGVSPYIICLGMVAGVFVARWTVPMMLKGTGYILARPLREAHLSVWAILAGMLWAVANTLTVFAIKNVGLSIAFPLWNTNSLVGLFWGWLLFNELRAPARNSGQRCWAVLWRLRWGPAFSPTQRHRRKAARLLRTRRCSASWRPSAPDCSGARCIFLTARPTSAA